VPSGKAKVSMAAIARRRGLEEGAQLDMEELRRRLLETMALTFIIGSGVASGIVLPGPQFRWELFGLYFSLFVEGLLAYRLRARFPSGATALIILGPMASLTMVLLVTTSSYPPYFFSLLVMAGSVLSPPLGFLAAALSSGCLLMVLGAGTSLFPPLTLLWMTAFMGWLSSRGLYMALDWAWNSQRRASRLLEELRDRRGELNRTLVALTEANRRLQRTSHELALARERADEARRVKEQFAANISHELRTPLNSIIGFADLLADADDERVRRYSHNISSSAKHLMSMINDLLGLAKIEAGKALVRFDRVSVTDTCRTLIALTKPMADKKELTIRAELADDVPIINTDGGKMQQVLYNLLSNAIKFTPAAGEVTVSAGVKANGDGVEWVWVTVADTGPGISEADQRHIFDKFYQADRTLTKESQEAGLGLAIAKELTTLLGGQISLASSPGHGAAFTVMLPVEPPKGETGEDALNTTR
jgi:signal transduction histidine kinase